MRIRRLSLVVLLLLVPTTARAHDHFADVCLAAADALGSHLWGPQITISVPTTWLGEPKVFSIVGDVSGHSGSRDGPDVRVVAAIGARYTFASNREQKSLPFLQVLFSAARTKDGPNADWGLGAAFGGGFERIFSKYVGARVQNDYIVHHGEVTPRISGGVVVRFY